MTIIIPPVPLPPFGGQAYNHITPFTYRDGLTYVEVLESLRAYIRDILVPLVDDGFDNLEDYVDSAVSSLTTYVIDSIAENKSWTEAEILALETYVNEQVQLIINDSIQVQDPVVAGIMADTESVTRGVTDALYADIAVETELAGRLSEISLDRRQVTVPLRQVLENTGADVTAGLQSVIDAMGPGQSLTVTEGNWRLDGTVTIPHNDFDFVIEAGATIDRTESTQTDIPAFVFTGDNVKVSGHGEIISLPWWDGTNTEWLYSVIHFTGLSPMVSDVTLTNVNKVGIGFKNTTGVAKVNNVTIVGNFPANQWTELNTAHFGIGFDPGVRAAIIVTNSEINSCVQGVCTGNFGTGVGDPSQVAGNRFEGCHNHAIYNTGYCDYMIVSDNTIVDCSRAIAMTGDGHNVSNNNIMVVGAVGNLAMVASIHLRNSSNSVIANNIIKGEAITQISVIDISVVSGYTGTMRNNVITGNTIEITNDVECRGIRVSASKIENTIISNNIITCRGMVNQGVLSILSNTDPGNNVIVEGNVVNVKGRSHGIFALNLSKSNIVNNIIAFMYDDTSAAVLGGIAIATGTDCAISSNRIIVDEQYGLNVSLRGIYELGTSANNRMIDNVFSVSPAKLTAFVLYFILNASNSVIQGSHPGAPTGVAGKGSRWFRTDGGANTTFYVKETDSVSATWRAI